MIDFLKLQIGLPIALLFSWNIVGVDKSDKLLSTENILLSLQKEREDW